MIVPPPSFHIRGDHAEKPPVEHDGLTPQQANAKARRRGKAKTARRSRRANRRR